MPILYKGHDLGIGYRADFVAYGAVIVELKAVSMMTPVHEAQIINYLKASGLSTGLLLNFAAPRLEFKRFIHTPLPSSASSVSSAVHKNPP